jgi:hypothetical protein
MVVSGQLHASAISSLVKALPLSAGGRVDPTADLNSRDMRTVCLFQESTPSFFVTPARA